MFNYFICINVKYKYILILKKIFEQQLKDLDNVNNHLFYIFKKKIIKDNFDINLILPLCFKNKFSVILHFPYIDLKHFYLIV